MRLSAKPLKAFVGINTFSYSTEFVIRESEDNILYFQLFDLDKDLRYVAISAEITVTFPAPNGTDALVKTASLVSSLDTSIYSVSLLSSEKAFSGAMFFEVSEGGSVKKFALNEALIVEMTGFNISGC